MPIIFHLAGIDVDAVDIENPFIPLVHADQHLIFNIFKPIDDPDAYLLKRSYFFEVGTVDIHGIKFEIFIAAVVLDIHNPTVVRPGITGNIPLSCTGNPAGFIFAYLPDKDVETMLPWPS